MAKLFDPIKAAGQKGDVAKAKTAYAKASDALGEYLDAVELPSQVCQLCLVGGYAWIIVCLPLAADLSGKTNNVVYGELLLRSSNCLWLCQAL